MPYLSIMIHDLIAQLGDPEIVKAWGPVFIGILTVIGSFGVQFFLIRHQRKQFDQQIQVSHQQFDRQIAIAGHQLELSKSKEEREEIIKKLNSFYGPIKELRTQSRILYRKFAPKLKAEHKKQGHSFRTLSYLLQGNSFAGQDAEILDHILKINAETLKLIEAHCGVVDKPELQELLGKLSTHVRILQLARDGKLSGPAVAFEDIVFPRPIDGAIESAILRLQDRLQELSEDRVSNTVKSERPSGTSTTIQFYDENADEYANQTIFYDLSDLYDRFRNSLQLEAQVGGRILDAGCGAGRDTRYFIENAFIVISFDASAGMVRKCQEYPHAYCLKLPFDEIQFREEFDGVWACASILHLTRAEAKRAISRLATATKPGGVMFISLKEGEGHQCERGRYFEYYGKEDVKEIYQEDGRLELVEMWTSSSSSSDKCEQVSWLNLLLRRKQYPNGKRNSRG